MHKKHKKIEANRLYQQNMTIDEVSCVIGVSRVTVHRWTQQVRNDRKAKRLLSKIDTEITKEWHPTKNGNIVPDHVLVASNKKAWWQCSNGHEWETAISNRTVGKTQCPYCVNSLVSKDNCLAKLNPVIAKEWHLIKNGDLTPENVLCGSSRKAWWQCQYGHEWMAAIYSRSSNKNGCPYCSNKRVCNDNCLATVNPQLSKEWHPTKNGELKPTGVLPNVSRKVWWVCSKGHEWHTKISHRSNGSGCPTCNTYYHECQCRKIFESIFRLPFPPKRRFLDKKYELDGYCEKLKLAFEYQGQQHYKFIPLWHKTPEAFKKQQRRDALKVKLCEQNGIKLIIIPYTENNKLEAFILDALRQKNLI